MDGLVGDEIHVKDVLAVVDVGDAEVDFKEGVFGEEELAFGIDVEAMVRRQTALVQVGINDAQVAVGRGVVEVNALLEREELIEALYLREGESGAEVPASAEFPFAHIARGVSHNEVDVVTAVEVRLIADQIDGSGALVVFLIVPVDEAKAPLTLPKSSSSHFALERFTSSVMERASSRPTGNEET